jgi:hypothetical protein
MATGPQSNPGFKGAERVGEGKEGSSRSRSRSDIYYGDRYLLAGRGTWARMGHATTMTAAVEDSVQAGAAPGC